MPRRETISDRMIRIDEEPSGAVRGALGGQLKNSHPVNCPTVPREGEAGSNVPGLFGMIFFKKSSLPY